jgi:hypothetical protein
VERTTYADEIIDRRDDNPNLVADDFAPQAPACASNQPTDSAAPQPVRVHRVLARIPGERRLAYQATTESHQESCGIQPGHA